MEYMKNRRGDRTEYTDNYKWGRQLGESGTNWNARATGLFDTDMKSPNANSFEKSRGMAEEFGGGQFTLPQEGVGEFQSLTYPSIYRETVIHKDDRGKYIDPFKNIASKPYGRRLMYDQSHPQKMYESGWSSEIADVPGCYSFPTTTGLEPEQPFTKNLTWKSEGEEGHWPTEKWQQWTGVALSPPYDGCSDQPQYSQYKVHVP